MNTEKLKHQEIEIDLMMSEYKSVFSGKSLRLYSGLFALIAACLVLSHFFPYTGHGLNLAVYGVLSIGVGIVSLVFIFWGILSPLIVRLIIPFLIIVTEVILGLLHLISKMLDETAKMIEENEMYPATTENSQKKAPL